MWTLDDLRHHYGEAYKIEYQRGRWLAARRDDGQLLTADGPEQLLGLIRDDYQKAPVPRDLPRG
jgi:hypothetical protein